MNHQISHVTQSNLGFVKLFLVLFSVATISACVSSGKTDFSKSSKKPKSDKAMIHAQLARGYLQKKQYAVARDELNQALRINPNHSISNYVMALLMMELKQYEDTERYFARAVRSDPQNSSAAHDYGMFLCQIHKERESVEYFELAANNPLFERPDLSLMRAGECLARIKDPNAEAYLKKALSKNSRLSPALFRLAVLKYRDANYFSARAFIERYFAINKPQPQTLMLAYQIESKLNATDAADKYRKMLLNDFSGSDQAAELRRQLRQSN